MNVVDHAAKPMALVGRRHEALHSSAAAIGEITGDLVALARRMWVTCRRHNGLAIAAPQVGRAIRLVVLANGVAVANPIIECGGPVSTDVESCLSLPGRRFEVPRFRRCLVAGLQLDETPLAIDTVDLDARMWQHELFHLDGRLINEFPEVRGATPA